ncbi:OmpH family outer membrane protein [Fertoeibacter niger]|nr:OmpH family outer membrane protein [Fertoeibacter niger]
MLGLAGPLAAQGADTTVPPAGILTVTQERLFSGSRIGQAAEARFQAESRALVAENREIETALEAEERDLTNRRATLPPEEFRALADAFDAKAEGIRDAREAKSRALTRQRDEDRQRIFAAAVPVLAALMEEMGAVAIIERSTVLISFDRIDITEAAIARLDQVLGDGSALPEAPGDDPGTPRAAP